MGDVATIPVFFDTINRIIWISFFLSQFPDETEKEQSACGGGTDGLSALMSFLFSAMKS